MRIESGQLVIARSNAGVWSIRPRTGRSYSSPVAATSIRKVYGTYDINNDFIGKFGTSQRFQQTVNIFNVRGLSGMDGLLQAMIDEVDVLGRFSWRWAQMLGTDSDDATLSANADEGAVSVTCAAGTPIKPGRLIQFEDNGKLHRVSFSPATTQQAAYTMGIFPALTKDAASGDTVKTDVDSLCRFAEPPSPTTSRSIILSATLVIRESRA